MASEQLSRAEALARAGVRHACHVMLYCDTNAMLFGVTPIRHIVLLVDPLDESLEAGLSRELMEETGVALAFSEEDHVAASLSPPPGPTSFPSSRPPLMAHFYVKKMEEEQIRAMELAGPSQAKDHGLEVLGVVRVPLYFLGGSHGLPSFLANGFAGNARGQLLDALGRFGLVAPDDLRRALLMAAQAHAQMGADLGAAQALAEGALRTTS